jgi:hypothetical protein
MTSQRKVVRVHDKSDKPALSKAQKQFNSFIKKIEAKKKLLQHWQETLPKYHQRLNGEYEDLWTEYNQHRAEFVRLLDAAYPQKNFTKTDKNKLKHLINTITTELIFEHGMEELKDIYNKYSDTDYDSDNQALNEEVGEFAKSLFENVLGIEIDEEIDLSSPEKLQAAIQEKLLQQQEQQRLADEKRSKRKKTAKQLEKEAKLQQEEQNVSKSIQEVYRKLAGALHPDRERDEAERERKTKLMQQVNTAYAKKDLLRLLELQLELEHIDQTQLNNIAEDRLKHFNKILQDQLKELEQEIAMIEHGAKMQANFPPFMPLLPQQLLAKLEYDIQDVAGDIARIKKDIAAFQELPGIKAFLKIYKIPKRQESEEFELGDLASLFFR